MIRNNDIIHGYTIIAVANGMALAHSDAAPDPYVVWHITENGDDVYGGVYQSKREEAEWDFCCKAFPWFEDNAPVNMIEDEAEKKIQGFTRCLEHAKAAIDSAAALVEDMVVEHSKLEGKKEAPQEESAEQEPFCVRDFAERGHREVVAQSKEKPSNPIWTVTPRLAIDEHGISLGGVYLPDITRFSLKDSGNLDGIFLLDIETDVRLP